MPPNPHPARSLLLATSLLSLTCNGAESLPPSTRLSPLAPRPDWTRLDAHQESIDRATFEELLYNVYAPGRGGSFLRVSDTHVEIDTGLGNTPYRLRFAPADGPARKPPRTWRRAAKLPPAPPERPLHGLRIALEPGHIGGKWARMEERWFRIGDSAPVMEGEMTLRTARLLATQLQQLGAEVSLVRNRNAPLSRTSPDRLRKEAAAVLAEQGMVDPPVDYLGPSDPMRHRSLRWQSELLFYRVSEIRQRANRVNNVIQPDLTVCLHFNAEPWGDPASPELVNANHLHLLLNGNFRPEELQYADIRFDLFRRLLGRTWEEELAVSESVAKALAAATGLPPYRYPGDNARPAGNTGYVWTRNLLANRLFDGLVLYLEPYVMNSPEVFARVQAGDYEGLREVDGIPRESLYREYARGVAEGLAAYYRKHRRANP